jgi:hypothetical protein
MSNTLTPHVEIYTDGGECEPNSGAGWLWRGLGASNAYFEFLSA